VKKNIRFGGDIYRLLLDTTRRFFRKVKGLVQEQFNKNIYTRILFTNVTAFVVALLAMSFLAGLVVRQVTYAQAEQELLRKAKRVNFALLQQGGPVWGSPAGETGGEDQKRQELLKFLADTFDARITIFDLEGTILDTSAEQEVVPGSKVDGKFVKTIIAGEIAVTRAVDRETGQPVFNAVVPMGKEEETIEYGILLEAKPASLDLALSKTRLYLVVGGMIILVIIIILSVYLAMHISRPISRLATTVAEISRGSDVFIEDDPLDEINTLAGQLKKLALRHQMIQAESRRTEEERARLFAEISHELRTPLTTVQGFVEAIRDGIVQDVPLRERYLDTIYTQTLHIARLVDDILALSRLESGNFAVEKMPLDLVALAQGVTMSMETAARDKNTSILFEKNTDSARVMGDADRMEQIIRNLLKNAVAATENGTIRVKVEARQGEVILAIEDNGIGIAPEDLPHIWDRFYQAKNRADTKGSGLGLVIVKKLVQLQGGKIDVASRLGEGTTFTISFPLVNQNK
jgi:signal transduction histidine kinase